jgi:hypothetical protein
MMTTPRLGLGWKPSPAQTKKEPRGRNLYRWPERFDAQLPNISDITTWLGFLASTPNKGSLFEDSCPFSELNVHELNGPTDDALSVEIPVFG